MAMTPGMMTLDCTDPRALAKFWTEAAGYVVAQDFDGWYLVLTPASGLGDGASSAAGAAGADGAPRGLSIGLQKVPEPRTGKNRAHLDWHTDDRPAEVARLVALGATVLAEHEMPGFGWTVLADPEGNEFCVGG
jgi:predicted enzyme related to lactoylglutathione lyase